PQVFLDFDRSQKDFDDLSVLPTSAFFYGLSIGEEISVEIDPGKVLFIKLISIGEANAEGERTLFYQLNGMPREALVVDTSLNTETKSHPKGDPGNPAHAVAPMPGMVTEIGVPVGAKVAAGDKLLTLEAMKMLTSICASSDGVVKEILVAVGDAVDTDDLLVTLEG
ncbi:MAG: biotin/lipoyl-containing protein, partial [Verrucomicrobiota bacterium]